jgi:hypothetical protein
MDTEGLIMLFMGAALVVVAHIVRVLWRRAPRP